MTPVPAARVKNIKGATENKKKMENLFVYGTLKDPEVQERVFGRKTNGSSDILQGYKKSEVIINGKTYPAIVPNAKTITDGLVITVTPQELKLIDEYETAAYKRIAVRLKSGVSAWVYRKV